MDKIEYRTLKSQLKELSLSQCTTVRAYFENIPELNTLEEYTNRRVHKLSSELTTLKCTRAQQIFGVEYGFQVGNITVYDLKIYSTSTLLIAVKRKYHLYHNGLPYLFLTIWRKKQIYY